MRWLLIAAVVAGLSDHHVIISNHTGLVIARIEIDKTRFEGSVGANVSDEILISVTPTIHQLRLVFRGGANVDWPRFNFAGIHEIIFDRIKNKIQAHVE